MVLATVVAMGLQVLVNRTCGADSPYYVGHLIVMVTVGLVMRSSALWVAAGAVMIIVVYLVGSILVAGSSNDSLAFGLYFLVNGAALVIFGAHMRHTLRRREHEAMKAQDRLVNLGMSTAQIAHDLKNVVGALINWPDLIADADERGHRRQLCDHLADALSEADGLVRGLGQQARFAGNRFQPVEIGATCRSVLRVQQRSVEAVGRLETDFEPDCWVHGDPGGLFNAIMNMVVNATHSLRDTSGLDPLLYVGVHRRASGIEVTLRDNGIGMGREQ